MKAPSTTLHDFNARPNNAELEDLSEVMHVDISNSVDFTARNLVDGQLKIADGDEEEPINLLRPEAN